MKKCSVCGHIWNCDASSTCMIECKPKAVYCFACFRKQYNISEIEKTHKDCNRMLIVSRCFRLEKEEYLVAASI